ncbi:MAG: PEP-utilizing enzyme [Actinomycetota bacterium]|nr:PEP-utilizing enzyme [Actinomycetota bacterium]
MVLRGRAAVLHREGERAEHPESDEGALPTRFQLTEKGKVVPVAAPGGAEAGGTGAGGGRARGRVHHSAADAPEGAVLVVRTLDPQLASALPRLAGLVAETGSVLAHVAILAREYGVPTVVGVADAHQRYPEGSLVSLDGTTGEVRLADEEEREAAP